MHEQSRIGRNLWIVVVSVILSYTAYAVHIFRRHPDMFYGKRLIEFLLVTVIFLISMIFSIRSIINLNRKDFMTGINNINSVMMQVGRLHFQKKSHLYTGIFLNMKESRYMNERYGNSEGDRIIREYAARLESLVEGKGYVGRLGGDNFFIFVKNTYLNNFLEDIKNVEIEVELNGETEIHAVNMHCGLATLEKDMPVREILNRSSAALAQAKERNVDSVVFEQAMQQDYIEEKALLSDYEEALKNNEFINFYQPKVDAKTGKLCGAEALVRWKKDGEILSPGKFIPTLERAHKIEKIDMCVFENMCRDLRLWIDMGIEPVRISSNFSKEHLMRGEFFVNQILSIMAKYQISPDLVEIELTESSALESEKRFMEVSKRLKENGIQLALDDFGTGYSSLAMLQGEGMDVVKLDQSFVRQAHYDDVKSKKFIEDIILMLKDQNLRTICEGVETKEQLDFITEVGCTEIQGFYFDKPMGRESFKERLLHPMYEI